MSKRNQKFLLSVCGLPGVGKSEVCRQLVELLDVVYFETDHAWLALFPNPRYDRAESNSVFSFLCRKVEIALYGGESVIFEGVLASEERILELQMIARRADVHFLTVGLRCDQEVAFQRMESRFRASGKTPVGEALWEGLALKQSKWDEDGDIVWLNSQEFGPESLAQSILGILLSYGVYH